MRLSLSMISSFFTLYNRRRFRISAMTLVDTKESSRDTRILRIEHYHKQSTAVTIIDWEINELRLERQPRKVEGVHSSCSLDASCRVLLCGCQYSSPYGRNPVVEEIQPAAVTVANPHHP
ncbi:hypothetical protein J6590_107709 [Homalodisca vitripennis]|nr:hypothetical protein J6590_107709 [Homalodisca vitripennis]